MGDGVNETGYIIDPPPMPEGGEEEATLSANQPEIEEVMEGLTAFVVVVKPNYEAIAVAFDPGMKLNVHHEPTMPEVWQACAQVVKDVQASETAGMAAQLVVQMLMQQGAAAAQQMQAQQIQEAIAAGKLDPSKAAEMQRNGQLFVPGNQPPNRAQRRARR